MVFEQDAGEPRELRTALAYGVLCLALLWVSGLSGSAAALGAALVALATASSAALLDAGRRQVARGATSGSGDGHSPTAPADALFYSHIAPMLPYAVGAGIVAGAAMDRVMIARPIFNADVLLAVLALAIALAAVLAFSMPTQAEAKAKREARLALVAPSLALAGQATAHATGLAAGAADGIAAIAIALAMGLLAALTGLDARRHLAVLATTAANAQPAQAPRPAQAARPEKRRPDKM